MEKFGKSVSKLGPISPFYKSDPELVKKKMAKDQEKADHEAMMEKLEIKRRWEAKKRELKQDKRRSSKY